MNSIKLKEEIQFGKYKGHKPKDFIEFPKSNFTQFVQYVAWARKQDNIEVEQEVIDFLFEKQREYNWEEQELQRKNKSGNSNNDMEPNIWGNDCMPGEMSSWF